MITDHAKTSIGYLRRSPFQALAAISVLSVSFFVTTLIAIIVYASGQVLNFFETRPQVIAFLNDDAGQIEINALRNNLESDERIKSVKYVSKDEALKIYQEATSDNPVLGELVSPSIFPASLEFSVNNLDFAQEIIDQISRDPSVESVSFTASLGGEGKVGEVITRLKTITYYLRVGGLIAILILGATSFLVLMVVIGMKITMRRNEIESLSLIGARPWFIRAPIVLEAINYSLFGVLLGWGLATVSLMYATPSLLNYFQNIPVLPKESPTFFGLLGLILIGELLIGLLISITGGMLAISRSLKLTK